MLAGIESFREECLVRVGRLEQRIRCDSLNFCGVYRNNEPRFAPFSSVFDTGYGDKRQGRNNCKRRALLPLKHVVRRFGL